MEGLVDVKLVTELSEKEKAIIDLWRDEKLFILDKIEFNCYLLSMKGTLNYSDCFGEPLSDYEKKQKYVVANPNRVIKYYNYYLLEDKTMLGEWHIGESHNEGSIEFYKCCENLEYAFQSL